VNSSEAEAPLREIVCTMNFVDTSRGNRMFVATDQAKSEVTYRAHDVRVANARLLTSRPSLDAAGFELVEHRTAVTDFGDPDQQERIYRPEVERIIRQATGADKVIVFHMQLRDNGPDAAAGIRKPARIAHVDYDEETFRLRTREVLGDEADYWLDQHYMAINVWRGVKPVENVPLAVCDARTIRHEDLHPNAIRETPEQLTPYTGLMLDHQPEQKWYYYPDMQPNEALVFKLCDSDHGPTRHTAHSAIDDPTSRPDSPPRVSFEVRTMAFRKRGH
jgi:hypothetical protein